MLIENLRKRQKFGVSIRVQGNLDHAELYSWFTANVPRIAPSGRNPRTTTVEETKPLDEDLEIIKTIIITCTSSFPFYLPFLKCFPFFLCFPFIIITI